MPGDSAPCTANSEAHVTPIMCPFAVKLSCRRYSGPYFNAIFSARWPVSFDWARAVGTKKRTESGGPVRSSV